MDLFNVCLNGLSLAGQAVMHSLFVCRLLGKRLKIRYIAAYGSLLCAIEFIFSVSGGGIVPMLAGVLVLYGVLRFALGSPRSASWLAAILAFYVSQLSFGLINSVESVVFPNYIGNSLLYPLLLAAQVLFFVLCACCYGAVLKFLSLSGDAPCLGLPLFSGLFFFAAELYILRTSYSWITPSLSLREAGKHGTLLILQAMGLAALLCTLYAYQNLCRGFQDREALRTLTQAAQAQKSYIAEARLRDERTRAFRHDVKHHLSVLNGLLSSGKVDECRAYLGKLETVSETLSFPCQTGNPVVDILLGEKLGLMSDVAAEVSLVLPKACGMDDFDLCVIVANALDNAVAACRSGGGTPFIRVSGKRQGDFYMLTFENSCDDGPLPPAGIGRSNIQAVAEKYHGAVLTEKSGGCFSLSVLLNIS